VFADTDRVAQVMSNLIGNALKFTPSGGSVSVTSTIDRKFVVLEIRDTGTGIAAEDLPFVFDRFWQSRRTNRSGAGLGLAIARGIVLGHGGRIWIESTPGAGTSVRFTLPAREPVAPES
jgi:signal transduction histidine kinase